MPALFEKLQGEKLQIEKPQGERHFNRDQSTRPSRAFGKVGWTPLIGLLLALTVVSALAIQVRDSMQDSANVAYCVGKDTHEAAFLLDLRKPLAPRHAVLPGQLLAEAAHDLRANTELTVYALADYAEAPRMLLGRLCKPYDSAELMVEAAKDENGEIRDCSNLPAQIAPSLRDSARRFCEQRDALIGRIDTLASQARNATVDSAFLIEAIEETGRDFQRRPGSKSLYVFSDMMQHADWFSHIETGANRWNGAALRANRASLTDSAGIGADTDITVFYLAHEELTASPERRLAHQAFWQAYFGEAQLAFNEQAPVLRYQIESLTNAPTEAELLGRERERLRHERVALERLRSELERDQQALAADRRRMADEARRRESELEQERRRFLERMAELTSERDRLAQLVVASDNDT